MVTWGNNTVFGGAPGAAPATPGKSTAPAGGGFSFGGPAAAPAAPAAGGGLFGTPAPAGTPGAPTKSPSPGGGLFGAPAPAPVFGAPSPAPTFGAPAPSPAGGLFGAAAPAPAFGAPAPAPAGGGLFGTPAPAPAGGGLFGAPTPATAAPSVFGGTFGATAAAAPFNPAATPHQAAYAAHHQVLRRQEAARLESAVLGLHSAYSPTSVDPLHLQPRSPLHATQPSSLCRFRYVFYDPLTPEERQMRLVHGPSHQPARPPYVDAQTWAEACARNPDPEQCIPVVVVGAEALAARLASQQERARTLAGYVKKLAEAVEGLKKSLAKSVDSVKGGRREHEALRGRTLELMRRVEIVRCMNLPLQPGECDAGEDLRDMVRKADAVGRALGDAEERGEEHARRLRAAAAAPGGGGAAGVGSSKLELGERRRAELYKVLSEQGEGLAALASVAKRDLRDVNILKEEVVKDGSAGGIAAGALPGSGGDHMGIMPPVGSYGGFHR